MKQRFQNAAGKAALGLPHEMSGADPRCAANPTVTEGSMGHRIYPRKPFWLVVFSGKVGIGIGVEGGAVIYCIIEYEVFRTQAGGGGRDYREHIVSGGRLEHR